MTRAKKTAKRKRGRPPGTGTGRNGRRVNLYLAEPTIEVAKRIGEGSISAGVQRAVHAMETAMGEVYNYETAETLTQGLQGYGALQTARRMAQERNAALVLEQDGEAWLIKPDGSREQLPKDWA